MKLIVIAIMVISVLFVAGCTVAQQPTNQQTETITPPVLEMESSTAPVIESTQVYQVALENGNLMPVDVEINAGDTVEWVNKDTVRYTLMFNGFEERLPVGGTFEQTFTTSGIVRYSAVEIEGDEDDRQEDRDNNLNELDEGYNQEDSRENNQERELHGMIVVN